MNPAIEKLTKYLQLEEARGYDNRAVMGGLQRMLEPWREEAENTGVPDEIIKVVVSRLKAYPNLSPSSREETLQGLWNRLSREFPDEGIHTPSDQTEVKTEPEAEDGRGDDSVRSDTSRDPEPVGLERDIDTAEQDRTQEPEDPSPQTKPKKARTPRPTTGAPASLEAPLTTISGIGPKSAKTLGKLGLENLGDLLWHLPRRYDDYSQLKTINRLWYGEEVTIIGTVEECDLRTVRGGKMKLVEAVIGDGTGSIRATWFNQPWIARRLKPGRAIVLSGKVDQYLGHLTFSNPEWEPVERNQLHTNRIVPVYPLTAGVTPKWLRRVIHSVVNRMSPRIPDPLPDSLRERANLLPLGEALKNIHFPENWEILEKAQHRLAFDEMFLLQLGVLRQKREWEQLATDPLTVSDDWMSAFLESLPYQLTKDQGTALKDIRADLERPRPMNRLLQGDVGSGKTVIAAAGMAISAANGKQSVMMAPTSILAEQHYLTLQDLLTSSTEIPSSALRLLLGSTPESEKQEIRSLLQSGEIQVLVGTHALLEDPVRFHELGLAIIDEQHRFGVEQRSQLRSKSENPNLLVMTATPIPRSLALTLYGDLDLTVIVEMPPGRQPVETRVLRPIERVRAHSFLRSQLESGHQAFIVFPLVEESEKVDAKAAVEEHERLAEEVFPEFKVGLLHGRMKADEKEQVMEAFRAGEFDLLVSTTVVEVGVDIPGATVMLVEGANRFGLAQLHQLRGRVGRGESKSYCLLIPDDDAEPTNERLKAMESTTDGFELAELDLDQRGPGDFLGTRQSGFEELQAARLTDIRLIEKARREASQLFDEDPDLIQPEHKLLRESLDRFWSTAKGEIS